VELPAPEIFEDEKWIFPMEFMRELAAAQMRQRTRIIEKMRSAQRQAGVSALMQGGMAEWAERML